MPRRRAFLCFGGLDWWYQHRSHVDFQLTRYVSQHLVALYVNSIVMQKVGLANKKGLLRKVVRKSKSVFTGLRESGVGFHVYSPFSLPVHHWPLAKRLNDLAIRTQVRAACRRLGMADPLILVVCPVACDIAMGMAREGLGYLRTDAYELFPHVDRNLVSRCDRLLRERADATFYVSRKLFKAEQASCRKAVFLDHGVDYDMFARAAARGERPAEMRGISGSVVGFFGTLDEHTVDIDLCVRVARSMPECTFVFVGRQAGDYRELAQLPNTVLIGMRAYEEMPAYGAAFDVCIMPWRKTEWIDACNPIKLKEYLALGKPVVTTPFQELREYAGLYYGAESATEFADQIRRALAETDSDLAAARRRRVEGCSWESKAELLLAEMGGGALQP